MCDDKVTDESMCGQGRKRSGEERRGRGKEEIE